MKQDYFDKHRYQRQDANNTEFFHVSIPSFVKITYKDFSRTDLSLKTNDRSEWFEVASVFLQLLRSRYHGQVAATRAAALVASALEVRGRVSRPSKAKIFAVKPTCRFGWMRVAPQALHVRSFSHHHLPIRLTRAWL